MIVKEWLFICLYIPDVADINLYLVAYFECGECYLLDQSMAITIDTIPTDPCGLLRIQERFT